MLPVPSYQHNSQKKAHDFTYALMEHLGFAGYSRIEEILSKQSFPCCKYFYAGKNLQMETIHPPMPCRGRPPCLPFSSTPLMNETAPAKGAPARGAPTEDAIMGMLCGGRVMYHSIETDYAKVSPLPAIPFRASAQRNHPG